MASTRPRNELSASVCATPDSFLLRPEAHQRETVRDRPAAADRETRPPDAVSAAANDRKPAHAPDRSPLDSPGKANLAGGIFLGEAVDGGIRHLEFINGSDCARSPAT